MEEWIVKTSEYVQKTMIDGDAGHNWWHVERVWKNSVEIARLEDVNIVVVQLGALLHDIADHKFNEGNELVGPEKARGFLNSIDVSQPIVEHVVNIVANVSFKGGNWNQNFNSLELQVVQDADRLDAIGAIGIARAFNYGGYKNRELYNPNEPPKLDMTAEEYKSNKGHSINHFYEKLLLLKDKMHTSKGKQMANVRHQFMEAFLTQFYREWNGEFC